MCVGAGGVAGIDPRRLGAPRPTHDVAAPCARPRRYLPLFSYVAAAKKRYELRMFFRFTFRRRPDATAVGRPSRHRRHARRAPSRLACRGRENGGDRDGEAFVRRCDLAARGGAYAAHSVRRRGGECARAAHQPAWMVVGTCRVPALRLTRMALSGGDVEATCDLEFRASTAFYPSWPTNPPSPATCHIELPCASKALRISAGRCSPRRSSGSAPVCAVADRVESPRFAAHHPLRATRCGAARRARPPRSLTSRARRGRRPRGGAAAGRRGRARRRCWARMECARRSLCSAAAP